MVRVIAARAPSSEAKGYNVVCSKCKTLLRSHYDPGTKDYLKGKKETISMCGPCYSRERSKSK